MLNLNSSLKLLSRKEAAELLGVRPQTLAVWTLNKLQNLPVTKIGRHSKYLASSKQHNNFEQATYLISETYKYSLSKNSATIDDDFSKWLVTKNE